MGLRGVGNSVQTGAEINETLKVNVLFIRPHAHTLTNTNA